ncbi:hypothetical protein ABZ990_29435 [Streptomyces sp. NPDC046203]|uniref:hypothetical protein n=1 Tax=Streptomyces sp. NPDC046203 TaxID=3154602 RepID=UPI0033D3FE2C
MSPEAAADAWEDWVLSLRGEERLTIRALGAPGYAAQRRVRVGLDGQLDGAAVRLTAASALFRSGRSVRLTGTSSDVTLTPKGLGIRLQEDGVTRGMRLWSGWKFPDPTGHTVLAACLFEWAMLDYFPQTPVLRLL